MALNFTLHSNSRPPGEDQKNAGMYTTQIRKVPHYDVTFQQYIVIIIRIAPSK